MLERELRDALARFERGEGEPPSGRRRTFASGSRRRPQDDLLRFRSLLDDYEHADVLRVVLARAARSARLTTHFDLDFPRTPQIEPVLVPQAQARVPPGRARRALPAPLHARHARAPEGVRAACASRARSRSLHGDAREVELGGPFDAVVTSPPYPGLIDYHEQHRYAYELLGLDDLPRARARRRGARHDEGGDRRVRRGDRRRPGARAVRRSSRAGAIVIVVNDRRELYPEILERAGLVLEQRYRRHVNRRTGRRAGEYFEDVLVARRG